MKLIAVGLSLLTLVSAVPQVRGQAGDPDLTFNGPTNMNGEVYAIAVQNDGKIVIGGSFTEVDGLVRNWVARLHSASPFTLCRHSNSATGAWRQGYAEFRLVLGPMA